MSVREPSVRVMGGSRPLSAPVVVRASPPPKEEREEEDQEVDNMAPAIPETANEDVRMSDTMLGAARQALSNLEDLKSGFTTTRASRLSPTE